MDDEVALWKAWCHIFQSQLLPRCFKLKNQKEYESKLQERKLNFDEWETLAANEPALKQSL